MEESMMMRHGCSSKWYTREEKEVAKILLGLQQQEHSEPPSLNWGRKRKRSAIQDVFLHHNKTQNNPSSPDTPLSFLPSTESHQNPKKRSPQKVIISSVTVPSHSVNLFVLFFRVRIEDDIRIIFYLHSTDTKILPPAPYILFRAGYKPFLIETKRKMVYITIFFLGFWGCAFFFLLLRNVLYDFWVLCQLKKLKEEFFLGSIEDLKKQKVLLEEVS